MNNVLPDDFAARLIDHLIYGVIILDSKLNIIKQNPAVEKISGYTPEELEKDIPLEKFIGEEKYFKALLDKLNPEKKKRFDDMDIKLKKKSGEVIPVHLCGHFIECEEDYNIVLVIQDSSSKKAFEKVLEASFDNFIQTTLNLDNAMKKIKEQRAILQKYKKDMEKELFIAKSVQKSIIPDQMLSNDFVEVWGISRPSTELGGDYFDYFHVDSSKIGILIADVSGHGVPSSLITTMIKVYFERYAREMVEVEKVFTAVNLEITKTLQETGFYFTSFYSVIDMDTLNISSACAGHEYALCYHPEEDLVVELGKTEKGTVIGSFEEAEYDSSAFQLTKGCKIIYFTDGITEARSKSGEFFGMDRLRAFLLENKTLSPKAFIKELFIRLDAFYDGAPPNDDRTIIVADVKNIPKPENLSPREIKDIVDVAFANGRKYLKLKQYSPALQAFQKVVHFDKKNASAYSFLGQILGIYGDLSDAERMLQKSVKLNPDYVQGYYFLGIIYYKQKKYKEARETWLKLKELAGDFKNVNAYLKKIEKLGI